MTEFPPLLSDSSAQYTRDVADPKVHEGSWRNAVAEDWRELELAPVDVCADHAAVLKAVEQNPDAFKFAAPELRNDKSFVLQAVRLHGTALQHASDALKQDRDIVMAAIAQDHVSIRYASEELRADHDAVVEAMRGGGHTLQHARSELNATAGVVVEASHTLNPEMWRVKVKRDWRKLAVAPANIRADLEILSSAVGDSWGAALEYASEELRSDRKLVLEAVSRNGLVVQYASAELRADLHVVYEAVRQTWKALEYAEEGPRADDKIVREAFMQNTNALQHRPSLERTGTSCFKQCNIVGCRLSLQILHFWKTKSLFFMLLSKTSYPSNLSRRR